MQYVYKQYAVAVSSILAVTFAGQAMAQGAAKTTNIGLVDKNKVITSFDKAKQAADELKKKDEYVHGLLESSNKQFEDAKAAKKSQAELDALQKRLQAKIDTEFKTAQARAQTLEAELEKDIDKAVKDEADSRKLDTVLLKDSVLLGGVDITDGVIKRLPATASAATKTVTK